MTWSDSDTEKHAKARKKASFVSPAAERTRPKTILHRACSPSHTISAPIARHEHKRRRLVKTAATLGGGSNRHGNSSAGMRMKKPVTEIIDVSEYRTKYKGPASKTRRSSMQGLTTSWKKPRASVQLSSDHVGHGRLRYEQGSDSEDSDAEGFDEAEFKMQNSCSASKIGPSRKGKLKTSFPADTPSKDASSSSGYYASFCPKDAFRGSDHARVHARREVLQIESDSDDMIPEDNGIKIMDEARRTQKKHFETKIGQSSKGKLKDANSSAGYYESFCPKDAFRGSDHDRIHARRAVLQIVGSDSDDMFPEDNGIKIMDEARRRTQKKKIETKIGQSSKGKLKDANSSAGHSKSFCPKVAFRGSDHASRAFLQDSDSDDVTPVDKGIKIRNEIRRRNQKTHLESKRGPSSKGKLKASFPAATPRKFVSSSSGKSSTKSKRGASSMQGHSAVHFRKNTDIEKELSFDSYRASSSEDAKEQADRNKPRSFTETVNTDEDTESEDLGVEKVDISEFIKAKQAAATSSKNVTRVSPMTSFTETSGKNKRRRKVSSYSESKKGEGVHDEVDGSTAHFTDSYSGSKSSSDDDTTSLQDDGAKHRTGLGVSSRTRSKMGSSIRKPAGAVNVSNTLPTDSASSPTDSGYHSSVNKDFKVKSSDDIGVEFLGTCADVCEVQNNNLVSAEKDEEDCNKEEVGAVEHASDQCHSILQSKESNIEKPALDGQKVSSGKRQSNGDASSIPAGKGKSQLVKDQTNSLQKTSCSKESFTHKGCDGENELHLQAEMRSLEKPDLPSPSKNDYDQSEDEDDHTQEKTEATSSVPRGRTYDECSMLADVILGRSQMTENDSVDGEEVIHEESKQAPASQTQDTLPLKFRFEDLVPKPVEKTAHEMEMDDLFDEMYRDWALSLEEMRTLDFPEVNLENEKSPAEEIQYDRCCRGKHECVLKDDEGLICIFCRHVVLEPKDIMPDWIERPYRESARKRYSQTEETVEEFDERHFQSSTNNVADCDATGTVWSIKPGLRGSLYEHQREGFEFLWKNLAGSINVDEVKSMSSDSDGVGGCIISHAPGTGKTLLTIVFLETYLRIFPDSRPVIIAPASMLLTWEEEFKKWNVGYPFLNLNNSDLSGKDKNAVKHLAAAKIRDTNYIRMIKIFNWSKGGSILGISYTMFEKLVGDNKKNKKREACDHINKKMGLILGEKPGLVVLDEGHTPRNERSNIWNALLKLETQKRVILSGTPFQNNFGELFNTLRLVRPEVADMLKLEKTYASFMVASSRRKQHHEGEGGHSQSPLISEAVLENLKASMSPFVHVHKGTILQESLPGLRDCVVVLKPPALQKSLIEGIRGANTFKYEHAIAMISTHPYLFIHCEDPQTAETIDMDAVRASKLNPHEGVKTRFLLELVRLSNAVGEKVLVFSQYLQPLQLIKEQLEEIFKWVEGNQILVMKGSIEQKQRQYMINLFNDPKSESKIMLASTRCCCEGISLVGASRVVLLDVVWNPSVERQAISRAYRIGQKKFVYTYHLMTSGTTEDDKYCRQAEKERMSELVFTSANEQKHLPVSMEDRILQIMVGNQSLKGMFVKIINQPKETDLIESFGL